MLNKPKKTKYLYNHRVTTFKSFSINPTLLGKSLALIATENSVITASQLASALLSIKRNTKGETQLISRIFPQFSVTKRAAEQPLGKGKGPISYWAFKVKAGTVLFELETDQKLITKTALLSASKKLPFKTMLVDKHVKH